MKNLKKFNTTEKELIEMLKRESIKLTTDSQIIFNEHQLYTHREFNLYNPNRNLNNALKNEEVFCFVPCFDL
jgi:fibrillarin-like rRNA methylase